MSIDDLAAAVLALAAPHPARFTRHPPHQGEGGKKDNESPSSPWMGEVGRRPGGGGATDAARPFIVGITGAVASGKSTLAGALAPLLAADGATVEVAATDGFLLANAILDERRLTLRKGYPETYDLAALGAALRGVRAGPISIPAYSHVTYDIDPALSRSIAQPDILIVEGLALGLERPADPGLIDCLVYIEAAETDLETWFVARFMSLWEAAADDPASFYRRFRDRDAAGAEALARMVWSGINLPNLRDHIAPVRAFADLIVEKAADHSLLRITRR